MDILRGSFILVLSIVPLLLSALDCSVCRKEIRGKYLTSGDRVYCSGKCFHSTRPLCVQCGERCAGQSVTLQNMNFCSRECLHKKVKCSVCRKGLDSVITVRNLRGTEALYCRACSRTPQCYFCILPVGNSRALKDGRYICRKCRNDSVTEKGEILAIFRSVRADLADAYGYDRQHRIKLYVVGLDEINRRAPGGSADHGNRIGLMHYQEKKERTVYPDGRQTERLIGTDCSIYILHTVPHDLLRDALAHELTHDHLRHHAGRIPDIAAEEGFCELVASLYNVKRGAAYLNRMKELNPSPVYGEGFRRMQEIYKRTRSLKKTMHSIR